MQRFFTLALVGMAMTLLIAARASALTPLDVTQPNATVSENFDSLQAYGASSNVPTGFEMDENRAGPDVYKADAGQNPAGGLYSYGFDMYDRAFGEVTQPSLQPRFAFGIRNETGSVIHGATVAYTGEEWRLGDPRAPKDQLEFAYSVDPPDLFDGDWVAVDALTFKTPFNRGAPGAKDGNSDPNRTHFAVPLAANVPPGGVLWLRWLSVQLDNSPDDGLAIDDLSISMQSDSDGDGAVDGADDCPTVANSDQADSDGDGQGDACDSDDDGDGVADTADNCPVVPGPASNHGCPASAQADGDGDGVRDGADNCPARANPSQLDTDHDGRGDVCDGDDDGDGVVDASDQCQTTVGTAENFGCPVTSGPPPPDTTACDHAKAHLDKKRAKLKKLRRHDASKHSVKNAKHKVKKAKRKKDDACGT
jgi:Thrombospondin type 3 repeat